MILTILKRYDINGAFAHDYQVVEGTFTPDKDSLLKVFVTGTFELDESDLIGKEYWINKDFGIAVSVDITIPDHENLVIERNFENAKVLNIMRTKPRLVKTVLSPEEFKNHNRFPEMEEVTKEQFFDKLDAQTRDTEVHTFKTSPVIQTAFKFKDNRKWFGVTESLGWGNYKRYFIAK
jgi:hypothetical protein